MTFYLGNAPSILRGLTKSRAVELKAVDDISLTVSTGEVVGLVGELGSGKTTLGRTILRLIEPTAGTIEIDGELVSDKPQSALEPMRRAAQIVFQNPDSSLNPRKTVRELLGRPIQSFGLRDELGNPEAGRRTARSGSAARALRRPLRPPDERR